MEKPNFNLTKEEREIKQAASKKVADDYTKAKLLEKQLLKAPNPLIKKPSIKNPLIIDKNPLVIDKNPLVIDKNPLIKEVSSFEDIKLPSSDEFAPIRQDLYVKKSDFQGSNIIKEGDIRVSLKSKSPITELWEPDESNAHFKERLAKEQFAKKQLAKERLDKEQLAKEDIEKGENEGKEGKEGKEEDKKGRFNKRKPPANPKTQIILISHMLLNSNPTKYSDVEMEVKFGTRGVRRITKTDYDNVIKKMSSMGFTTTQPEGKYTLKIQAEFLDLKSGMYKISNDFDRFRVELNEITNIQEFCKNGNIQKLFDSKSEAVISIMKKTDVFEKDEPVQSADFNDFNFKKVKKKFNFINLNKLFLLKNYH